MTNAVSYLGMADEYDQLLGRLAEQTWRRGVLAESRELAPTAGVIADLGAGTGIGGRLFAPAAGRARRVGIDRSASMLTRAVGWYEQLVQGELTDLPLRAASVDLAVSGFDTLNYLDPPALRRCLQEVTRCLRPRGWLIFDYSSPQLLQVHWRDLAYVERLADGAVRWEHRYQQGAERCVSVVERRSRDGELRWREAHVQYALPHQDVRLAAAAAGLRLVRVRDLDSTACTATAHTHVWTLRKETP